MRTLVISDLHLGAPSAVDVLRDPAPRAALVAALAGIDRLVLLGDTIEGRGGPQRAALDVALPVLTEIGAAMAGGEVVIVPGNHDHELAVRWLEDGPSLRLDERCEPALASPGASELARALAPASVVIAYPGLWLRDDVYATHGHYLDVHTPIPVLERLAAGAMTRLAGAPPRLGARPEDYERILAPLYAFSHASAARTPAGGRAAGSAHSARLWRTLAAHGPRSLRVRALAASFPLAIAAINRAGLGPVQADVSVDALRRGSLDGLREVVRRLGIDATHVIFGHTHRTGPLPGDDLDEWGTLVNAGSWVRQPHFTDTGGRDPGSSPYRAGGAVELDASGPPRVRMLLDEPPAATAPARA
ncbi:MAG TPA: metallophosphoesterase [Solirubrobacteraceae bacterium]|nr:metallophosphoesterase [Solirubrobacteraceae bacterium]